MTLCREQFDLISRIILERGKKLKHRSPGYGNEDIWRYQYTTGLQLELSHVFNIHSTRETGEQPSMLVLGMHDDGFLEQPENLGYIRLATVDLDEDPTAVHMSEDRECRLPLTFVESYHPERTLPATFTKEYFLELALLEIQKRTGSTLPAPA